MRLNKTIVACCLSISMLIGLTINAGATFNRSYTAPKGTPTIDGQMEELWSTAEWTDVDKTWDINRDTDSVLRIKLMWDDSNLYFLAAVYDTQENRRNDIVEIYLDQNNDKSATYGPDDTHTRFYVAGGVVQGDKEKSGENAQLDAPSAVTKIADNKYLVEGAISWPAGTPTVGTEMGLEFMYNDGTRYQAFLEAYRWNADTANGDEPPYASTEAFGKLILAEAGTPDTSVEEDPFEGMNIKVENTQTDKPEEKTEENKTNETDEIVEVDDTKEESGNMTYIIIGAVALVLIVAVLILGMKKRKNK